MSEIDQGTALSIRITITDHCQLVFHNDADPPDLVVDSELSRDQLKSLCDDLRPQLERFQNSMVPSEQGSERAAGEALRKLHLAGREILYELFVSKDKLRRAQEMCMHACPSYPSPGWDPNSLAPKVIQVKTSVGYGLPIDLLPLLDPMTPRPVENLNDLGRTAASFLGFSAIVKRTFGDPPKRPLRIDNTDSFPLKMFWDGRSDRLPTANKAKRFFEESGPYFDLKGGPWPNGQESKDVDKFCEEVVQYLGNPETSIDGQTGHRPDQLCYFFCHCDTSAPNSNDHVLYLGNDKRFSGQRPVTLRCLKDGLWQLNLRNLALGREPGPRPLVFLNACASASLNPAAATSFPKLFLSEDMGFLGFIGTEASVPDAFGSEFAEVFFREFVGGLPLGRALHAARWYMLKTWKSPLGILYTLFAEPEIETRTKVPALREKLLKKALH